MATPTHQTPTDDQLVVDDGFAAELFWEKNRKIIIVAILAVIAIVLGVILWIVQARNEKLAAESLFAEAKNPESWREVIAKYPGSLPAANAYFLLAETLREQGDVDESNKTYQKFISTFPGHPLIGGARLGLAENQALQGKTSEAIESLRQIAAQTESGYAGPYAGLIEGQILIRQGRFAEAKKVLQNTAQGNPASPSGRIAASLDSQLTALLPPEIPAATPAPSPTP